MANVTDPLIRAIQGSDPQNLMEYITRQKIYDSRFWKEECFGLAAVDVLEKAAKIKTIGGLPTKFLCLTLKLLQLQPDAEDIIESFIQQEDFKYVRALGALYLRLTGRPDDIYNELEPLYRDYRKLRCRLFSNWSLIHMDEFIHQLLTETTCVGITLPRLPARSTLQEAGYIDDGPRPTALREVLEEAGGPLEYLKHKVEQNSEAAIELYERRRAIKRDKANAEEKNKETEKEEKHQEIDESKMKKKKRKHEDESEEGEVSADDEKASKKKKKKDKERNYGSLFKDKKGKSKLSSDNETTEPAREERPDENSEEYWNEQRAKLGLKALK
jgi:pre-mRNA-splicing factor 38A